MPSSQPNDAPAGGDGRVDARADGDPRRAPVTLTQRSSLLMSAFNPSREFMSWVYQLNGKLDVEALAQAIDDVVGRHDMLRVRFEDRGDGVEQVVTPFHPGVMEIVRLDDRPKAQGLAAAVKAIETEYRDMSPWDDARLRATLYLVAPKTNVLAVLVAEALVDGDSGTLVAAEIFARAYAAHAGRPAPELPEPSPDSYLRYVTEHPVPAAVEERAERHWQERMSLPRGAGSWPTETGDRRLTRFFKVPVAEWEAMVRGVPALGTAPFVVMLSWFELCLATVAGAERFSVTSAVSNRRAPTKGMIGNFVGPVRLDAEVHPGESLEDVSPRVMAALRDAVAHSVVPVPLAEARGQAPAPYEPPPPLVSFFVFTEREGLDLPGVRQRRFRLHMGTTDILRVNCTPDEEGGRNFFFSSSAASPELMSELVDAFRGYLDDARRRDPAAGTDEEGAA